MNNFFTQLVIPLLGQILLKRNIGDREQVDDIGANDPIVEVRLAVYTLDQSPDGDDQHNDVHGQKHQKGVLRGKFDGSVNTLMEVSDFDVRFNAQISVEILAMGVAED